MNSHNTALLNWLKTLGNEDGRQRKWKLQKRCQGYKIVSWNASLNVIIRNETFLENGKHTIKWL